MLSPIEVPVSPLPTDEALAEREVQYFSAIARLAPTASIAGARQQLRSIGERLAKEFPDTNAGESFDIAPLGDNLVSRRAQRALHSAGRDRLRSAHRLRQRLRPC